LLRIEDQPHAKHRDQQPKEGGTDNLPPFGLKGFIGTLALMKHVLIFQMTQRIYVSGPSDAKTIPFFTR
jgi:hypothetical protein